MSIPNRLLNKEAKIYTKASGSVNSFGEVNFTLSTSVPSVKVALSVSKEELTFTLHGTTYKSRLAMYTNYRTDIIPGDVAEIDQVRYLILSVENESFKDHHVRCYIDKQ